MMQNFFRLLLGMCFVAGTLSLRAQFEGLTSFFNDSSLIAKVKANNIRSAQEFLLQNGKNTPLKKYYFTTEGKVCDVFTFSDNVTSRKHFEYNNKGLVAVEQNFEEGDTTKVNSSQSMQYNESGQLLLKQRQYTLDSKQVNEKELSSKTVLSTATKTIIEGEEFYLSNKTARIKYIDSLVGKDLYTCSYRFREGETDDKGRIHGRKTVERTHKKGSSLFTDEIEYEVYGKIESPKEIKSSYYEYDSKNRLLEFGEINYEDVYAEFLQMHPDNFNPYQVSPLFINEVFKNKIQGQKRANAKFTYNEKGQLIEKLFYGTIYNFEYDATGKIISYTTAGETGDYGKSTFKLYYNGMGLVSKIISESSPSNGSGTIKQQQELTYLYGH